ncbi:XdhC family protein [Agrobacterium cavarae]|uniref:XdhC family protein n=1 Tax=Agrobacterium cavarae TaxID=2528239 RepID=UPI000DDE3B39|nr:XdhC family protein [Agrobacterium cavarae]
MLEMPDSALQQAPMRASTTDDPQKLLLFAIEASTVGPVALATLVEIRGGAARSLGSNLVVTADGRFYGYVSGGCVESAIAAEALLAIAEGRDRVVKFGDGSPFLDIVLPCGGGITVAIHLLRDRRTLHTLLNRIEGRTPVSLCYSPRAQALRLTEEVERSGWITDEFSTAYRPRTRVVVFGQTGESQAVARLAEASSYDVVQLVCSADAARNKEIIDRFTAVVLVHHDLDAEAPVLEQALHSEAFYIGALGSSRTHKRRVDYLTGRGFGPGDIQRIKAPIGIFGPTRDSISLSLSILADIAATRLTIFG